MGELNCGSVEGRSCYNSAVLYLKMLLRNGVLIMLLIIPYFVNSSFFPSRQDGSRQESSRLNSFSGNSFNQPLKLSSARKSSEQFRSSNFGGRVEADTVDAETEQTVAEEEVRLRPDLELEQSIQGQVAEAIVRNSLINAIKPFTQSPRLDTTKKPVVRPPPPKPRILPTIVRNPTTTTTPPAIREPVTESRASDSRSINRRVVFPSSLAARRVAGGSKVVPPRDDVKLRAPESIKAKVVAEVDDMMKKHSQKMKVKLPRTRIEEIDREVHIARKNAEIENERLKAELDELRSKLLETENSLRSRIRSQSESITEKTRLNNLLNLIEKETSQLSVDKSVAKKTESRVTKQKSRFAPRGNAVTYEAGNFFSRGIDNSPRHPANKDSMVEIDGVEFPKFSRMIKNTGLSLLAEDELAVPVEAIVPPPSRRRTSQAKPRTPPRRHQQHQAPQVVKKSKPEPAVQGFKVKGDTSNRIIFLNIADLGLTASNDRPIKLGNSELVPVDGLTDFSDPSNLQPGKPMNIDAVDKMVTTHLQHNTQPRQPVNLPDFSHPLENFRGANNFAPDSRQTVNRRPQTTQSVVRKQPVQFFNKFEDGRLGKPQQQQQQPQQQTPTSRSSQQSLPPRQSGSRLPVQQQPSNNEKLSNFTQQQSFNQQTQKQQQQPQNNFQSQPQQQFNRFQPQQQQNRFQPQQQQNRFQPQQQNNNFRSQQQQQTPQFQPQQQTPQFQPQQQQPPQFQPQQPQQSVEEALKAPKFPSA